MTAAEAVQEAPEEIIAIESLNEFAHLVSHWHTHVLNQLKHLLQVPGETVFEVGDDKVILTGKTLEGFKLGVELALMQVNTLPFVAEMEDSTTH